MKCLATIPKVITVEDIRKQQERLGRKGLWNLTMKYPWDTKFILVEIPIDKLHPYGSDKNKDQEYFFKRHAKLPKTDISVIEKLKKRINSGLEVYPIIIDNNFQVLDGWHRLVAYKELGIEKVKAYKPEA